jgi:hypothetical protein
MVLRTRYLLLVSQIPVEDKSQYREQAVVDAFNAACLATDPTSGSRTPPITAPLLTLQKMKLRTIGNKNCSETQSHLVRTARRVQSKHWN